MSRSLLPRNILPSHLLETSQLKNRSLHHFPIHRFLSHPRGTDHEHDQSGCAHLVLPLLDIVHRIVLQVGALGKVPPGKRTLVALSSSSTSGRIRDGSSIITTPSSSTSTTGHLDGHDTTEGDGVLAPDQAHVVLASCGSSACLVGGDGSDQGEVGLGVLLRGMLVSLSLIMSPLPSVVVGKL